MMQQALADLKRAYINFFEGRAGFPKFKKKKSARQSFRIPQCVKVENDCVYVPSLGWTKIRQSQEIDLPDQECHLKRRAVGHCLVTLAEFAMPAAKVTIHKAIGFNMVLAPPNFLVGSDGTEIPAPRFYHARERKLRRERNGICRAARKEAGRKLCCG